MATLTPEIIRNCRRCGRELNLGALVCEGCQALVHSQELDRLADGAKVMEAKGQLRQAREQWLMGLQFLPPNSRQADWIVQHARALEQTAALTANPVAPQPKQSDNQWAKRFGPLAPIAILLAKGKFLFTALFKLKFLFSFAAFFGVYWALWGPWFGLGFATMILIHEMGHFIDIRRRGLPADMPVFLPGFGAYVRWHALGVSPETIAEVSLAGPLAGFLAALAAAVLFWQSGNPLWAALARTGAALNLLNLIPVWVLDGGQAIAALDKTERIILGAAAVLLAACFGQPLFLLVAAGAGYRVFSKDIPAAPSHAATAYYVTVLAALGYLINLAPPPALGGN